MDSTFFGFVRIGTDGDWCYDAPCIAEHGFAFADDIITFEGVARDDLVAFFEDLAYEVSNSCTWSARDGVANMMDEMRGQITYDLVTGCAKCAGWGESGNFYCNAIAFDETMSKSEIAFELASVVI